MKKMVNGVLMDMTAAEIAAHNALQPSEAALLVEAKAVAEGKLIAAEREKVIAELVATRVTARLAMLRAAASTAAVTKILTDAGIS